MSHRSIARRIAASTVVLGTGLSTAMCTTPHFNIGSSTGTDGSSVSVNGTAPTAGSSGSSGSNATSTTTTSKPATTTSSTITTTTSSTPAIPAPQDPVTPIKHVVVIFPENVSFDHYFATYPKAANTAGETQQGRDIPAPMFTAKPDTPQVNNLLNSLGTDKGRDLLNNNPNSVQPFRLSPSQAITTDQGHSYDKEQLAYNGGKMDKFVESTSVDADKAQPGQFARDKGTVMGYYDGNTVTGMWNYAQNYAMSDNAWTTTFGPSTPGAINLIAGTNLGAQKYLPAISTDKKTGESTYYKHLAEPATAQTVPFTIGDYGVSILENYQNTAAVTGDPDPAFDDCTNGYPHVGYDESHKNVGDLMNDKGVTWGWFESGFKPSTPYNPETGAPAQCESSSANVAGNSSRDYIAHHQPFQYFKSTANPHHLPPESVDKVGQTDQANHQYDMSDFNAALDQGIMPEVSFLKAPAAQDGHPAYSGPLDEQAFVVETINKIQQSPFWKDTAIIINYDDTDGWYDHEAPKVLNGSANTGTPSGPNSYGTDSDVCSAVENKASGPGFCGPGTRVPMIVISPYAKTNFVDHTPVEQASIISFIEHNWGLPRLGGDAADDRAGSLMGMFDFSGTKRADMLLLDPLTGAPKDTPKDAKSSDKN